MGVIAKMLCEPYFKVHNTVHYEQWRSLARFPAGAMRQKNESMGLGGAESPSKLANIKRYFRKIAWAGGGHGPLWPQRSSAPDYEGTFLEASPL